MNSPLRLGGTLLSLWLVLLAGLRAELILDDAGRFAVDMDAPQARSENEAATGLGKTTIHLLAHDGADGKPGFIVGYNDYPTGSIAKLDRAVTYTNVMKGVLDTM